MLSPAALRRSAFGLAAVSTLALPFHTAQAQYCSSADAAAGICLILPSAVQATPRASSFGFPGSANMRVFAAALGGISYYSADLYAFAALPDVLNPFATQNVLLGSKGIGGSITPATSWTQLPWAVTGADELFFGIRADEVVDWADPSVTRSLWIFSGWNNNAFARYDQAGHGSQAFSLVFGGVGPVGDQIDITDPNSSRQPTPAAWQTANIATPNGALSTSRTFLVGFEDNPGWSDGDFNDFVLAVNVSTVPEPTTLLLVGGGLLALGAAARRRRR